MLPIAVVVSLASLASAETPRAELGNRLRRFELAWQEAGLHERLAIATAVAVPPLFADASCDAVMVTLRPFYSGPAADASQARLRLAIEDARGTALASRKGPWAEASGAARLLSFAEAILAADGHPEAATAAEARRADCWLTPCDGRGEAAVSLRAPAKADGKVPALFLLHGPGGSENRFFDVYGAGRATTLACAVDRGRGADFGQTAAFELANDLRAAGNRVEERVIADSSSW